MNHASRVNLQKVEDDLNDIYLEDLSSVEDSLLENEDNLILDLAFDDDQEEPRLLPKIQKNDFEGVDKNYSRFVDKQLSFVAMTKSTFRYADFEMANMVGSCITASDFHGARMRYVDLEFSELQKADFSGADLFLANFQGSVIHHCDFSWANLKGANFADCQTSDCKFEGAVYDFDTVLPFGRKRANELGMILSLSATRTPAKAS